MGEEDEHSPSEFYYPEDLETFDAETETGITESREAIDDFINQQKSANTNKKTATDMNTFLRHKEVNSMKNEKIESLPAHELDHLLSKVFLNARKKNGEEYEPATVSSFQRSIQRYLSEKKYPFNILKDNEFEKSRKVLAAKRKSLVHEHGKGNKPQAAQAIDEDEEDTLFEAGEFGDSNPVALQRTMWWFLSLHSVSEQETKVVSCAGVKFSFNSRMMAKKSWFGWPSEAQRPDMVRREDTKERSNQRSISGCTFQIFHGNVKIVQNERKRRIVIWSDEDD